MSVDLFQQRFVQFQVLSQLRAGKIIHINEKYGWELRDPSTFNSFIRNAWSFALEAQKPTSQRLIFLSHVIDTTEFLIQFSEEKMQNSYFERFTDSKTGTLSHSVVEQCVNKSVEAAHGVIRHAEALERLDKILTFLRQVCKALMDGLKGIEILKSSPPYNQDEHFTSQLEVCVTQRIHTFLQNTAKKLGDFKQYVFITGNNASNTTNVQNVQNVHHISNANMNVLSGSPAAASGSLTSQAQIALASPPPPPLPILPKGTAEMIAGIAGTVGAAAAGAVQSGPSPAIVSDDVKDQKEAKDVKDQKDQKGGGK